MTEDTLKWWTNSLKDNPYLCESILHVKTIQDLLSLQNIATRSLDNWVRLTKTSYMKKE